METLNNLAGAASKTIFGDGTEHKEPVSGVTGDVSKGEPYDAGNLDPADQSKFDKSNPATPAHVTDDPVAAAHTSSEPTPKGDTTAGQTDPRENPLDTSDRHAESAPMDDSTVAGVTAPRSTAKPGSVDAPASKDEKTGANEGDAKGSKSDDPSEEPEVDVSGPGPKPVAQLAAEHGGDAGKAGAPKAGESAENKDKEGKGEGEGAAGEAGSKHEPGKTVVHATGLQADGGDFDAKNPGAAKEADRLMEEKGIKHGSDHKKGEESPDKPGSPGTQKKKLSERIKAKFHKGKE